MVEKKWLAVPDTAFTANGGSQGQVQVASTLSFKVKQQVYVKSNTQISKFLEVKRVIDEQNLLVGPKGNIDARENLSAFLTADGAVIGAEAQMRPAIGHDDYNRAVYEEEPAVAKRVILVDALGRKYGPDNPIPTNATFEGELTVNLNGTGPSGDTVGIVGENGDRVIVNPDGSFTVVDPALATILGQVLTALTSTLDVSDDVAQDLLADIEAVLTNIFNKLDAGVLKVDDDQTQDLLDDVIVELQSLVQEVTDNVRTKVLKSVDREATYTFADAGTKNQRLTRTDYVSTVLGLAVRKDLTYTLAGTRYVVDKIKWSIL